MAKKSTKKTLKPVRPQLGDGVEILNAGSVLEDPITRTLETNYMPYAMSVIVSRALPEIDGFKPGLRMARRGFLFLRIARAPFQSKGKCPIPFQI